MASSETFKPGLFDIGLNIEKKPSNKDLLILNKQLSHHVKFKPRQVRPAIYNLQAVLSFHMDSGRTEARLMLEKLVEEYPQDLNILADLIHVYKKMGAEKDSSSYKEKLKKLKGNKLLQARSILAQANAIHNDLTAEYHETPKVLLKDICWQLNMENKHLEQADKAIDMVVDAYKEFKTIPIKAYDETINAKEISIEKFEKGIKMLQNLDCSEEEILVWKHNLANARSKLENVRCKRGGNSESHIENCIKLLDENLDVIEKLSTNEEPLKICVARSYILFAQFYMSRKKILEKNEIPQRIKTMSQNLEFMWYKALSICPDDQTVLQRSGRYEVNKKEYLKGIKHYDRSIRLVPDEDINWFSYTSRSDAYHYYYRDNAQINKYLELAYNDGKRCVQSKCTIECMIKMANLSFLMAKPVQTGVSFHCEDIEFIYEAIETIHETFKKRGNTEYGKIHSNLGKYYPYIEEYRKSIESLKTALELNKWRFPNEFLLLCKCFVSFYKKDNNNKNLLSEFRFILKEAKKKLCDKWVTSAMDLMRSHDPEMLTDLTENMIEWDARSCDVLIDEALYKSYFSDQPESIRKCKNLGERFETKLKSRNCTDSKFNGPAEIQNGPRERQESQRTDKFKYDFYISHSEKDKDWVNSMLLPQVVEFDDEIKFKAFIPTRDFVPGKLRIDSIIEGIKQSCKLLIILTPNYLEDNWEKYVRDQMILSVIETKVREKTIIPLILESCEIPNEIQEFIPISFIEGSNWMHLRSCLTINMDSEMRIGKRMDALKACDIYEDFIDIMYQEGQFPPRT